MEVTSVSRGSPNQLIPSFISSFLFLFPSSVPRPVQSPSSLSPQPTLLPRFGHSMVLDPLAHTLFIFAGQRDEKYLSDMYAYDIANNTVSELFNNFSASGGPDACFTQRAVVDPKLREVYVYVGRSLCFFCVILSSTLVECACDGAVDADAMRVGFVGLRGHSSLQRSPCSARTRRTGYINTRTPPSQEDGHRFYQRYFLKHSAVVVVNTGMVSNTTRVG